LSAAARFVLVMLDAHANGAGKAWQSVATLSDETGFGTTAVREALRELEAAGEIVTVEPRKGKSTVYWICGQGHQPQRQALPHPNGIWTEPQRMSDLTPTPGVAEGFYYEGSMKERGRFASPVESGEAAADNNGGRAGFGGAWLECEDCGRATPFPVLSHDLYCPDCFNAHGDDWTGP
jgi:biotin operon repressor